MKTDRRILYAILITVILGVSAATTAVVLGNAGDDRQKTFSGEIIGYNSYNDPKIDLTADDLFFAGYSEGDMFDVGFTGKTIRKATLTHGFLGVFMFDTYLNTESDGHLAAGSYWGMRITVEVGSKVSVTYCGHDEAYSKLDRCLVNYTDDLGDYGGDREAFANFYTVSGGDLVDGKLYRSFNPYSSNTRSTYVNLLAGEAGIGYIASLSMNSETISKKVSGGVSGYCVDLYQGGKNTACDITYKYFLQKDRLKAILTGMSENDGPYLIHCNVGRDRTGFMTTLLQALCGASETEMAESAAQAYVNLYKVVKDSEEYKVIESCTYGRNIFYICNYGKISTDLSDENLPLDMAGKNIDGVNTRDAAYAFCTDYLGMDGSVVDRLINNLCS